MKAKIGFVLGLTQVLLGLILGAKGLYLLAQNPQKEEFAFTGLLLIGSFWLIGLGGLLIGITITDKELM